jgi:hypothetical protein
MKRGGRGREGERERETGRLKERRKGEMGKERESEGRGKEREAGGKERDREGLR